MSLDSNFILLKLFYLKFLDHLFNLRFAAKELARNAKKCDKQEKEEKNKLTAALKVLFNAFHINKSLRSSYISVHNLTTHTQPSSNLGGGTYT